MTFEKYYHALCFVVLSLFLLGVNRCQESYEIFSQVRTGNASATPTASPSASPTASVSPTASATPDESPTPSASADDEDEEDDGDEGTVSLFELSSRGFLREVAKAGDEDESKKKDGTGSEEDDGDGAVEISTLEDLSDTERTASGNWLGNLYIQDEKGADGGGALDSDNDGYTDFLEQDSGTSPNDPQSFPPPPVTDLRKRLAANDPDFDGLSNSEESFHQTNPAMQDSDGDGINDSAEVLSGSDPLDPSSTPHDTDGDSLSDEYELQLGTDPGNPDSDGDRLSDGYETTLKSDPLLKDTDSDGILDWREVLTGGDPVMPEKAGG